MYPIMIRILLINVCVVLVVSTGSRSGSIADGLNIKSAASANYGHFLIFEHSNSKIFLYLMKTHFDLSMKYLLTSKQYGSQYVERPGMAKYLNEASSHHWEEGMDLLKKFLQRGGSIDDVNFIPSFAVQGNPQLVLASGDIQNANYIRNLKAMLEDSKSLTKTMNTLHRRASKSYDNGGDAEIAHYFDDKLMKKAENLRELAGYINTLDKMQDMGVAVDMFDSYL